MKKFYGIMIVLAGVMLFSGCSGKTQIEFVKENMSEITECYFYGKCDDFEITISGGQREEPYVYDGISNEKCDFSLVNATANCSGDKVAFVFTINDESFNAVLEMNMMTGTYMTDIEKSLCENDVICVKYKNTQIQLECLSSTFNIGYEKALEIATTEFSEEITNLISEDKFQGECYLKVLDKLTNNFDDRFWCFSICDRKGQHLNCIISTENGEIIAKT